MPRNYAPEAREFILDLERWMARVGAKLEKIL